MACKDRLSIWAHKASLKRLTKCWRSAISIWVNWRIWKNGQKKKWLCAGVQFQAQLVAEGICPWCGQVSDRHRTRRCETVGSICWRGNKADYWNAVKTDMLIYGRPWWVQGSSTAQINSKVWDGLRIFFSLLFNLSFLFFALIIFY